MANTVGCHSNLRSKAIQVNTVGLYLLRLILKTFLKYLALSNIQFLRRSFFSILPFEPVHEIMWYLSHRRPAKDQAIPLSLARAFAVRPHEVWK